MAKGKQTCKILKEIRKQIAAENDIEFVTSECTYKGDCKGTCPKCETEVRYLERELEKRQRMGKAAVFAGMSLGTLFATTSCDSFIPQPTEGDPCVPDTTEVVNDSTDAPLLLESEMMTPAQDSLDEGKMTPCKSNGQLEIVGQIEEEEWTTTEGSVVSLPDDSELQDVYQIVDQMPEFPGGQEAMEKYIKDNIRIGECVSKWQADAVGRIFVNFIVEPDGSLTNVKVLQGIFEPYDEEVVRVVKTMPNWEPGMQRGKPVRVSYTIPIVWRWE